MQATAERPTSGETKPPQWFSSRACTAEEEILIGRMEAALKTAAAAYAKVQAQLTATKFADNDLKGLARDLKNESLTYGSGPSTLREFWKTATNTRVRQAQARLKLPQEAALLDSLGEAFTVPYQELLASIKGLDLSTQGLHPKRLLAAGLITSRFAGSLSHPDAFKNNSATYQVAADTRKAPPPKFWIAGQLKKLSELLTRSIDLFEKTLHAQSEARYAISALDGLLDRKFEEPKRATAEEVGRYLATIEKWCRERMPLERDAADKLLAFRKLVVLLTEAIKKLRRVQGKTAYLLERAVDAETEALVLAAREIHLVLRAHMVDILKDEDKWKFRTFHTQEALPDSPDQALALIDGLQDQAKNAAMAVANKAIANAHYKSLRDKLSIRSLPDGPTWGSDFDFNMLFDKADAFLLESEETRRENELKQAEVDAAFDAFEARRDQARRVAASAAKNGNAVLLGHPKLVSVDMLVAVHVLHKLKDLHGSWL